MPALAHRPLARWALFRRRLTLKVPSVSHTLEVPARADQPFLSSARKTRKLTRASCSRQPRHHHSLSEDVDSKLLHTTSGSTAPEGDVGRYLCGCRLQDLPRPWISSVSLAGLRETDIPLVMVHCLRPLYLHTPPPLYPVLVRLLLFTPSNVHPSHPCIRPLGALGLALGCDLTRTSFTRTETPVPSEVPQVPRYSRLTPLQHTAAAYHGHRLFLSTSAMSLRSCRVPCGHGLSCSHARPCHACHATRRVLWCSNGVVGF